MVDIKAKRDLLIGKIYHKISALMFPIHENDPGRTQGHLFAIVLFFCAFSEMLVQKKYQ